MNIDTAVEKDPVALDAVVDTSGGVREVFHDETLDGKGTKKDPLRVNKNIIATKEDLESKADKATTLAGYGITDAYTKEEINTKFGSVYHVKGSVATYDDLPDDAGVGDVYNILDSGSNYVWTGTEWDKLSETVDLSDYATKSELEEKQDKLTAGTNIKIEDNVISVDVDVLPDQTGNTGKFLQTNGEEASWAEALVNNATDANSVYIGNTLPQDAEDGRQNVLIGSGSAIVGLGTYNNTVVGTGASSHGNNSVVIGKDATALENTFMGSDAISIGKEASTNESYSIAIGTSATADNTNSIALGHTATAKGAGTVVIGEGAKSESPNGANVVIGQNAKATGYVIKSVAIGVDAKAFAYESTAVGNGANTGLDYSIAIGYFAKTTAENYTTPESGRGEGNIAIGTLAETSNNCAIAIGDYSLSHGKNSIALGSDTKVTATSTYGIAVGKEAKVIGSEGIAAGHSSNSARHGIALGTRANANDFGTIAIGLNTESTIVNAVSIGNQAHAWGQDSVALGSSAIVDDGAGFAVQLGVGTNSDANTLQFLDYKVLYENGIMPYERLSEYSPSDGQVLVYDDAEGALVWRDVGGDYELPTASTVQLGGVKVGSGLSINSNGVLSANVQEGAKWGNISGNIADQTDLQNVVSDIQSQIDSLSAIGQFLAIWDCDTHIARYLTEGHEYQSGNYFIIGSVAAEGGTNYMPDGSTYPGYAVTTEDVKVSDMWFYDGEHWIYLANHERSIAVDADLDINSSNPVENKTVTAAIEKLQNSVGVPQLASVDVLQLKTPAEAEERDQQYGNWMGLYSDIVVTLNLSKQEIIDRMYDLYLTVSRFKTNKNLTYDVDGEAKNYRNISKFSVMNDLRQKTNIRAYCWRMIYDDSLPETHPGRYAYFYTQDLYMDEQACLENAHEIGLWGDYGSVACGPATCLNAIGWTNGYGANEYLHDYGDTTVGIERYEEGDVSEFANVADTSAYPEYNLKDHLIKRECRRYTRDGENYYFWCSNWDDSSAEIYNLTDGNDNPIPNGIPKHMDELSHVWNVFDFPSTFEFVDKRPDLNYKAVVNDPYGFFEALQNLTFKGKYVDGDGRPTYWNCYWFDFPIMPVLLKDCKVRVMSGATKEDYSASVNVGEWHTLEYLANNGFLRALHDDKPVEIKLPYNTYYLWMRFCSLQKRCAYGDYSNWLDEEGRSIDYPMWPEQKLNLVEGVRDYNVLGRRAFARPRQAYRYGEYGKISEYIQFNVCSPMDAASGTKSKATPIQKKLTIDKNATTTIRN